METSPSETLASVNFSPFKYIFCIVMNMDLKSCTWSIIRLQLIFTLILWSSFFTWYWEVKIQYSSCNKDAKTVTITTRLKRPLQNLRLIESVAKKTRICCYSVCNNAKHIFFNVYAINIIFDRIMFLSVVLFPTAISKNFEERNYFNACFFLL